ncbi:hypothetical protein HIM_11398 [Hirsutella minnesotensis 3608]|uniref:Nucleoside phosphorylase domain-containing protein n=1 Tax=Hirsutella minnesotensis 3608 TaxID=1043627 RepID=A0A0F8A194_9HYPO|nr:hypothetical protein HIM_11398 [Hirsutella minnesotensis 3608]
MTRVARPASRRDFEIAIICALTIEADAVEALFDPYWDDEGPPYGKASGDPNAYSTGYISRHNVVLAHMPSMGKANAATVTANCRASFPNIKLALVIGVCGAAPTVPGKGDEIVLGDVIISDGVVQYDLGRRLPERFVRKDTLLDSLGRPNTEIRALLAKLKGVHGQKTLRSKMASNLDKLKEDPELKAEYPGIRHDWLFESKYRHVRDGMTCEECGCSGELVLRHRLGQGVPQPAVHFGLIACGDMVMKAGEERDAIAQQENVIGFEMESAGVWDSFPCVVIKGVCDYADSHKSKAWQNYAAATAAACAKAFLDYWVPSFTYGNVPDQSNGPWFIVPFPKNDAFVGRSCILRELQRLADKSQAQTALFGLGGIGKTQIALAYVYWLQETCPEVSVFWVHASIAERFRQSFNTIAQECRIPGHDDPKADVLPLVKRWLEKKSCGRWLMVIDNADDMELFFNPSGPTTSSFASDGNLARHLPQCNHGAILVTTRNKKAAVRFAKGRNPIEVDRMEDNESKNLLRATLEGVSFTPAELSELSFRLEHHPLALVQAAAYIQANSISMEAYLGLLDEGDHNVVNLLCEEFETIGRDSEAAQAVAQTWMLSFRQIKEQDALAGNLLSLMSIFDRQGIPTLFLSHYSAQERNGGPKSIVEMTKSIGLLKAFGLISEEKNGSLDMHRLVQLVTRKWLVNDSRMAEFGREALLTVSQMYPFGRFENRTKCSAYLPHASAVLKFELGGLGDDMKAKASLHFCVAGYLDFEGKWDEAEKHWVDAVDIRKRVLGEEHPDTLSSMAWLASTYSSQGRWKEAEEVQLRAMETSKRLLGEEHPNTLSSMARLASTYSSQGRWKEAEELQLRAMETSKRVLGQEHPDTLSSMAWLASTYRNQGRWKEAEELQLREMETSKRVLGQEHPDTLSSMASLASTYSSQGRWKEAEELQLRAMETRKRLLGEEHPNTLSSMASLASTYSSQGRWKEAEELQLRAMETRKRLPGQEHPDTLSSMARLASTYSSQGRWKEAEELQLRAMETRKRLPGQEHPNTLSSMARLASTYSSQGRWKEAEELQLRAMETRKRLLGEEHPNTLSSKARLASTYSRQGRWKKAEELQLRAMETRKRLPGQEHPDTLCSSQGQWKEAEELEVWAMETSKRVLDEEHPDTLSSMVNLASTYWSQGRWKEAEELEVRVMETRKRMLGQEHPLTLSSMAWLASTYSSQGRWNEAEELEVRVMETRKRLLDEEHPDTLSSMVNLASTYWSQGRWKEAEELEVRVMETRKRVLGQEHPLTLSSMAWLAST